ncbi:cell division control protein 14, SIN component-domain-containing protein [Fomes fomentarius]|nr:cell division control protein 14, SIN component-domain-containing protein [Fomes fomentarius]
MDHDNVHLNVAPMHDILQDALDDLVSTRTSTITKGDALMAIEHVLAETSDPRAVGLPGYFNALQDTFQCNVSSRIIAWTAATSPLLDKCLNKGSTENDKKFEVTVLSAQLAQAMGIIQGVALVHKPSKQFLGRRYSLEVLLDLLLVSRHLSLSTSASSTPTSPKAGATSVPTPTTEIPLASIIIDTLLCILVDSVPSLRVFEDLNGVQVVVKILKRAGTPREVRMKCLEFLYFYLLDETVPPEASDASDTTQLSIPDLPSMRTPSPSPSHQPHPSISATSQSSYTTSSPSSRSSSASSAFSVLSTSTTATSASLHDSPAPTKANPSERAPKDAPQSTRPFRPASKSVIPGLNPTNRTVTPPNGGTSVLGRGQPRSLVMLKKEVDYIPLSPKKPQLSHLSRGPSGLRPKLTERTSSSKLVPKLHPSGAVPSEDTEGEGSGKSPAVARTPRRIGTHSRGLSVSSISSLSSTTSTASTASTTSASASHSGAPSESKTPSRDKGKSKALAAPEFETPKASSKLHRRTQSLADFTLDSASPSNLKTGPRSASSPSGGAGAKNRGARTMQEKKDILGTMLGNVDALVEGVKKAGVWGLNT